VSDRLLAALITLTLTLTALARPDADPEPPGTGGKLEAAVAQGVRLLG
jgi:hypothetical protein